MLEHVIMESIVETLAAKHKLYFQDSRACSAQYEMTEDGYTRVGHVAMYTDRIIGIATNLFTTDAAKQIDCKSHVRTKTYDVADPSFNPEEMVMIISDWVQHGINRLNGTVL